MVPDRDASTLEDIERQEAGDTLYIRRRQQELTDRAVIRMHLNRAFVRLGFDVRDKRILLEKTRFGDLRRSHHRKVKGGDEEPEEASHPRRGSHAAQSMQRRLRCPALDAPRGAR